MNSPLLTVTPSRQARTRTDRPDPDDAEQLARSIAMSPSLTFADRERAIEMLRYLAERLRGDG